MIPLRDEIKSHRVPVINTLIILLNIVVFVYLWFMVPADSTNLVFEFAFIPSDFLDAPTNLVNIRNVFTALFLHAGILHLGGNMLYLWIFGDNVEDVLGHIPYLIFYLAGGIGATMAHLLTNPGSSIPTVGASGAIAAVLGAYLVLYPQSRILTFIPIGFFVILRMIPAAVVLMVWFILQLFQGVLTLGGPDIGGTAFWAHIGGFIFGVICALLFMKPRQAEKRHRW